MQYTYEIVYFILIGSQALPITAMVISGTIPKLDLCFKNHSVSVNLYTEFHKFGASCKCDAIQLLNPEIRQDYVHTPGIGFNKLHTDAKTWNDARKTFKAESAHLAIINSSDEEKLLVQMLIKKEALIRGAANNLQAFVGIHDQFKEGEWVTVFGESIYSVGYSHWWSSTSYAQPDNFLLNQNCGTLLKMGGMDDQFCNVKFAFFCEIAEKPCYAEPRLPIFSEIDILIAN